MAAKVLILIASVVLVNCQINESDEFVGFNSSEAETVAREERLRGALIDAFQSIKRASGKTAGEDDLLNSDLIGSVAQIDSNRGSAPIIPRNKSGSDKFDKFFLDDEGLTFEEAFDTVKTTKLESPTTEKSHNVQHIVKTTRKSAPLTERTSTTAKPVDSIISRLTSSLKIAVNESQNKLNVVSKVDIAETPLLVSMDDLLKLFDAELLVKEWSSVKDALTNSCRDDMDTYVEGLLNHNLWALKMEDASGRYASAFYWGNNYWTGSADLCRAINDHPHQASTTDNKTAQSQIFADWREDSSMSDGGPPFRTGFYTARLHVSARLPALIKTRRTIHLGLCLPQQCQVQDVVALLQHVRPPLLNATLLTVRAPHLDPYHPTQDFTFQLLLGVSCAVCVLLSLGTLYDVRLARRVRRQRRRAANMAADDSAACTAGSQLKLHLNTLDNVTMTKGKSIYKVSSGCVAEQQANSEERLTAPSDTSSTHEPHEPHLKLSVWTELLLSFSMKANILTILDQSVGSDTISVVHGLRSLSMVWVIFGHTCIVVFKYADNTALRAQLERSAAFQLILSAVYSVDTFFCLGGILVSFLYFRTNAKGKLDGLTKGRRKLTAGLLQFLGLIGYRFARLTAPYLFMLGVVEVTMKWFQHNAVFEPPAEDHINCPNYWWRNLLYINTLFPVDQMCMLWSWYLSDDTQFYAFGAILLILATSHFKVAAGATVVMFISSLLTTGYVSWTNEHIPNTEDPFTQFDKIYDKPWTRLGPYLVGMFTGWLLFKTNLRIRMTRVWACVGWAVSSGTLLFLIFGLHRTQLGVAAAAAYSSLSHSLWAAAVSWIVLACSTGYGGWVTWVLSAPVLYPFSRVTYCTYLVHPIVLRFVAMQLTQPLHLGEIFVFVLFLGLTVISFAVAFFISVAFEAPIVTMLKILAPQRRPHRV